MATNPVMHMGLAGLACVALITVVTGGRHAGAALLGMIGPLAVAIGSWLILERLHARAPQLVSGMMIKLFGAKMLLFGGYVAAVVLLLPTGISVFVGSLVSHYILLHLMEALYLRRLFSGRNMDQQRLGVS